MNEKLLADAFITEEEKENRYVHIETQKGGSKMDDGDMPIIFLFIVGIITTIILIVVLEWLWMIKSYTSEMANYTKSTAEYASFIYQNIFSSYEKESKEKKACIKEYFPYAEYVYMDLTPEEKIQADREDFIRFKRKSEEQYLTKSSA